MGFYGNITDSSHTHFQFDKIFSSRTEMDRACLSGTDGIYAGRFVLVKYNIESRVFQGDILYGYYGSGNNSQILYRDVACTKPYIYTTFTEVQNPIAAEWESYYVRIQRGDFYFRLNDQSEFASGQTYYTADAFNGNNDSILVSINTIVRLRDAAQNGALTSQFLRCIGTTSGQPATWEVVSSSQHYQNYFDNFALDQRTYGDDFNHRGYDATVWQKVYGEGSGRFIQVASLNTISPSFEFVTDPPSSEPLTAWIDPTSTAEVYRIHVPTHWGFRIKEEQDLTKSDVSKNNKNLAIYMNLGTNNILGQNNYHINESHVDDQTINKIDLSPSGVSGTLYNGETQPDIQELSINLPIVGNMIDKGYDLIYGPGHAASDDPNDTTLIRARDIAWYEADQDILKRNGHSEIGGKTYDLTSLAGIINTMHTQLGQVIKTLPTRLADDTIPQYSQDYIYYITDEDKYFRIAPSYRYTTLTNADYNFIPINYDPITYVTDTYYTLENGNYVISTGIEDPSNPPQLYKKSIRGEMYHEITNLIPYVQSHYFVQQGIDYIRDNADQPSYSFYPDGVYYDIVETTSFPGVSSFSGGEYQANTYRYLKDGNYYLDTSSTATADRQYYWNVQGTYNDNVLLYMKNKFHYLDSSTGTYSMCTYDTVQQAREALGQNTQLYWLEFDETKETIISYVINGVSQTYIGHPLKENGAHPLSETLMGMINPPSPTDNFYCIQGNDYIAYTNMNYDRKTQDGVPLYATKNSYITINSIEPATDLYVTGKYYYIDSNGSYIKAMSSLDRSLTYYLIDRVIPLTNPFYVPNKYYYESSEDYFEIDITSGMTSGRRYYNAEKLYVIADYTGRCPYGYEWSNYSVFVPASITLGRRQDGKQFIEIVNFMKDGASINSNLLQLEKFLETNNADTRDKNTVRGALNQIQDALFVLDRLVPRQMLFVNDFGQITSSTINYTKLLDIVNKYDAIMAL